MISHPSLMIYSFAPKSLPSDTALFKEAREHLRRLWGACSDLDIKDAIQSLSLPTSFPDKADLDNPSFRTLAAKMSKANHEEANVDYQSFAFEYQDILGLVISLETNSSESGLARWKELHASLPARSPSEVSKGIVGEVYVYGALYHDNADEYALVSSPDDAPLYIGLKIGEEVFKHLPGSQGEAWRATTFNLTGTGSYVWEGAASNGRRVLVVVAPLSKMDTLFDWLVWVERTQLAPFARYLMHTSKIRFTQQIFERDIYGQREQLPQIDSTLKGLLTLHGKISEAEFTQPAALSDFQSELNRMQDASYGLLYKISRLKEIRLTTHIAENNIRELLFLPASAHDLAMSGHSPFKQDFSRAKWLREQIDIELGYLQAVWERVEEGHNVMSRRLESETHKNARKLNELVLLQGSFIGALVVALAAAQAFGVKPPFREQLYWPLIGLLGALALALPPIFTHWHDGLRRADLIAGGLVGTALTWLGTMFWAMYLYNFSIRVSYQLWVLYEITTLVAGFYLACHLLHVINRASVRTHDKLGKTS